VGRGQRRGSGCGRFGAAARPGPVEEAQAVDTAEDELSGKNLPSSAAAQRAGWDALIILGSNIKRAGDVYRPSTYEDYDTFGMLAGEIRVIAAVLLYERNLARTFVFSTGISEKTRAALGSDVPSEAAVYSEDFLRRIGPSGRPAPKIIPEDRSVNTYSNLAECAALIRQNQWKHVAIMSARYHIPRTRALWQSVTRKHPVRVNAEFLAAEDVVTQYLPGVYDDMIEAAYGSPQGQKRLKNEAQGIQDLKDGTYVLTEFQLR
jgi:uncharacterized SAM-binding protein YcdF (DUF218 family)